MTDEPTLYVGNITLKNYTADNLTLTSNQGESVFTITPYGMFHLGPAYKENPDAAAQEFIRIIMDMMPKAFAARSQPASNIAQAEISAWTDDNERDLNTAVADTMWHWDTRNEGPLDPDDAISLTEALKIHLKDNGFQIVRLATRAQGESS